MNGPHFSRECEAPAEPRWRASSRKVAGPRITLLRFATVAELALSSDSFGQSKFADNAILA